MKQESLENKKSDQKKKYYVDPIKFKELITEYYKTDDFSEELGEMVNKISEHVAYMPNFINYHNWKDEMISDSNYKMVKALNQKKYDPAKGNPFAYFTKICCRAFINVIKKEKKADDTITRYQNEMYDELILKGLSSPHQTEQLSEYDYEYD